MKRTAGEAVLYESVTGEALGRLGVRLVEHIAGHAQQADNFGIAHIVDRVFFAEFMPFFTGNNCIAPAP